MIEVGEKQNFYFKKKKFHEIFCSKTLRSLEITVFIQINVVGVN